MIQIKQNWRLKHVEFIPLKNYGSNEMIATLQLILKYYFQAMKMFLLIIFLWIFDLTYNGTSHHLRTHPFFNWRQCVFMRQTMRHGSSLASWKMMSNLWFAKYWTPVVFWLPGFYFPVLQLATSAWQLVESDDV